MEKLIYVLWRPPGDDPADLARFLLDDVGPVLLDAPDEEIAGARLTIEAPEGASMRAGTGPGGALLTATVSVWVDSVDDRGWIEELLGEAPARWHGYLVTESVPRAYPPRVLDEVEPGEPVPGMALTTVFVKRPDISDDEFYGIWHGEHTPLSFELHPLWFYVRNSVFRALTVGAPNLSGIVYEAVPSEQDLLDFHRFFGSGGDKEQLLANIERVNDHMATFADLSSLQTTPTRDYPLILLST